MYFQPWVLILHYLSTRETRNLRELQWKCERCNTQHSAWRPCLCILRSDLLSFRWAVPFTNTCQSCWWAVCLDMSPSLGLIKSAKTRTGEEDVEDISCTMKKKKCLGSSSFWNHSLRFLYICCITKLAAFCCLYLLQLSLPCLRDCCSVCLRPRHTNSKFYTMCILPHKTTS